MSEPSTEQKECHSCGEVIKRQAEICPECGVRQQDTPEIKDKKRLAEQDAIALVIIGFVVPPLAYVMVGRYGLAALNLITFNYFLFGFVIVPYHIFTMFRWAEPTWRSRISPTNPVVRSRSPLLRRREPDSAIRIVSAPPPGSPLVQGRRGRRTEGTVAALVGHNSGVTRS